MRYRNATGSVLSVYLPSQGSLRLDPEEGTDYVPDHLVKKFGASYFDLLCEGHGLAKEEDPPDSPPEPVTSYSSSDVASEETENVGDRSPSLETIKRMSKAELTGMLKDCGVSLHGISTVITLRRKLASHLGLLG